MSKSESSDLLPSGGVVALLVSCFLPCYRAPFGRRRSVEGRSGKDIMNNRYCECLYDISMMAAYLIQDGKIIVQDSRELFLTIMQLSEEFEESFLEDDDYMEQVEMFAHKRLTEIYKTAI